MYISYRFVRSYVLDLSRTLTQYLWSFMQGDFTGPIVERGQRRIQRTGVPKTWNDLAASRNKEPISSPIMTHILYTVVSSKYLDLRRRRI